MSFEYLFVNNYVRNALRKISFCYKNSHVALKKMKMPSYFDSVHYRYNFTNIYSQYKCAVLHDMSNTKPDIKNQDKSQKVLFLDLYHLFWLFHHCSKTTRIRMPDFYFFLLIVFNCLNISLMNLSYVFLNIYLFIL